MMMLLFLQNGIARLSSLIAGRTADQLEMMLRCILAFLLMLPVHPTLAQPQAVSEKKSVARVGASTIIRSDILYRMQIEQAYGATALPEEAALMGVMQDAVESEIAREAGVVATEAEIAGLSRFADENSKAPEILQRIKDAFGENRAAYARLYLCPKIVNHKLRHHYSTSAQFHQAERARIEQALQLVNVGRTFEEAAIATGLITMRQELENKPSELPVELKRYQPENQILSPDRLFAILDQLEPGTINPDIIESDDNFRVLRLIARNGSRYSIETIAAAKPPFEHWFDQQVRMLPIEILDARLRRDARRKYSGIDWVRRLK